MQERISTEEDYRKVIMRFLEICDAEPGTSEYEEAILLTRIMEEYEDRSCYDYKTMN